MLETYIPARESKELCAKTWTLVNRPILPGYVIISSSEMLWEIQKDIFLMSETCYGLLRNVDRTFELKGSDRQFAIWIEDNKGLIKASQVILDYRGLTPDDRITVVSGPMREMRGRIVSIYKGTRVTVEMEFLGEVRRVTLPIEVVKKIDAIVAKLKLSPVKKTKVLRKPPTPDHSIPRSSSLVRMTAEGADKFVHDVVNVDHA